MPGAWAHSHYWARDEAAPPAAAAPTAAGYHTWQTTIIIGSGFAAAQVMWDWLQRRRKERADGNRE